MTWNYYALRFPDKETADSLLLAYTPTGETYFKYINTDVIGTALDIDGVPKQGWLVNIACEDKVLEDALLPYLIGKPQYPTRVWL